MKIHTKKKQQQRLRKDAANRGLINRPDGTYVARGTAADSSMKRDFYPQRSA